MNTHTQMLLVGLCLLAFTGCSTPIEYEDDWLDDPNVQDPSLSDPSYLVSTRPGLTQADLDKPVIITAHGYTASTYEWGEFRAYAESDGRALVSLVLLGGHGRSVEVFEESTWQEWGQSILDEYQALVEQGYTHISLASSSTGGALILEQISTGAYDRQAPEYFFFVDPIVIPGNKLITMAEVLGPIFGNQPRDTKEEEEPYWYTNRPAKTVIELKNLINRVRSRLADGFTLPAGSRAKVYKTARDGGADPAGALLIYKGMTDAAGQRIEVEMIDSDLHVFTRLRGRDPSSYDASDRQRQQDAFEEIVTKSSQANKR